MIYLTKFFKEQLNYIFKKFLKCDVINLNLKFNILITNHSHWLQKVLGSPWPT